MIDREEWAQLTIGERLLEHYLRLPDVDVDLLGQDLHEAHNRLRKYRNRIEDLQTEVTRLERMMHRETPY
jgi:hypothetical protein